MTDLQKKNENKIVREINATFRFLQSWSEQRIHELIIKILNNSQLLLNESNQNSESAKNDKLKIIRINFNNKRLFF